MVTKRPMLQNAKNKTSNATKRPITKRPMLQNDQCYKTPNYKTSNVCVLAAVFGPLAYPSHNFGLFVTMGVLKHCAFCNWAFCIIGQFCCIGCIVFGCFVIGRFVFGRFVFGRFVVWRFVPTPNKNVKKIAASRFRTYSQIFLILFTIILKNLK